MFYSSKEELEISLYTKYGIPMDEIAFIYKFDHIIEERSYDIENEFSFSGKTIYYSDLVQVSTNVFNFIVISTGIE